MATIIDGRAIAREVRAEVAADVAELVTAGGGAPGLATVLVGDDAASRTYVRMKREACVEAGMTSIREELPARAPLEELLEVVDRLNADERVDGILVQLPVPGLRDPEPVLERVDPAKDVDGFHPVNVGRLASGHPGLAPATAVGIVELLRRYSIPLVGADALVIGRSDIVGRPTAALLLHEHCTVTVAHSRTRDLADHCRRADIVVAAVGRAGIVRGDMLRPGATVVDAGTNPSPNGLVGDVDFASAEPVAGAITPVPGGVGPMTIAMLLRNTLAAARARRAAPLPRAG
jgi:methylenetetrahydrofolate dehydrogenase (NADP+) / methenyltetrahydrofolate cyclohydrolase